MVVDGDGDAHFCATVLAADGSGGWRLVHAMHDEGGWRQDERAGAAASVARCSLAIGSSEVFVLATTEAGLTLVALADHVWSEPWELTAGAWRGAMAADATGEPWVILWRDDQLELVRVHDGLTEVVGPAHNVDELKLLFSSGVPHVAAWTSPPDAPHTLWAHLSPADGRDSDCDGRW